MARAVQLNNIDHSDLRVRTERSAGLGDAIMSAPVFPHEFRQAQGHYPIVFSKEPSTDLYRPVTLFGFERGENLFLGAHGWDAPYVPLAVRMQPFLIGFSASDRGERGLEVHIDPDHPRVSRETGEPLFLPHGGRAPYLEEISALLGDVHVGESGVAPFSAMLSELELVEPFTLDVTLRTGETGHLAGFHTIAEEKLYALDGDTLGRLQAAGMLQPVFMAVASLAQFTGLIERKNRLEEARA